MVGVLLSVLGAAVAVWLVIKPIVDRVWLKTNLKVGNLLEISANFFG